MTINPKTKQAYKLMHDGVLALGRAEQQGIRVDLEYAEQKKIHLTWKINRLEENLHKTAFYRRWAHISKSKPNINSPLQLAYYLYTVKKLEPARLTPSKQGATDEESLKALNIPALNDMLEIRKLKKVRDTYIDAFIREQVDGYVHPSFNLHLVRTYRSSSDRPNFQNIPKRDQEAMRACRQALYPRPGNHLLEVDYSGLEVRIAACYHQDPRMLKYINNPASDMHADMAKQIFLLPKLDKNLPSHNVLRDATKNGFVFPEFYGDYYKNCASSLACQWGQLPLQGKWKAKQGIKMPEGKLSDHMIENGIKSLPQFTEHIKSIEADFWTNRFPDYARWKNRWWRAYQKYGYLDMKTGFRCSEIMNQKDVINYPIQGSAFHCLLWSFIELDRIMQKEKWNTRLIGQIHDSIIFDVPPDELYHVAKVVKQVTCIDLPKAWDWIVTPLDIDMELSPVDKSWADKEKFVLK